MSTHETGNQKMRKSLLITIGIAVIAVSSGVLLLRNPQIAQAPAQKTPMITAPVAIEPAKDETTPMAEPAAKIATSTITAPIVTTPAQHPPGVSVEGAAKNTQVPAPSTVSIAPKIPVAIPQIAVAPVPNKELKEAEQKPATPEGCFALTYHHKKTPGHGNEESCLNHRNVLKLKHPQASSVCVRVNQVPVAFERVKNKPDQVLIGAMAGPQAEITVRYCLGKSSCAEECSIPKDDFMNSLGGVAQNEKEEVAGQWEPAEKGGGKAPAAPNVAAHLKGDLKKELDNLDQPEEAAQTVFQDWIAGSESPSCGTRQAMR